MGSHARIPAHSHRFETTALAESQSWSTALWSRAGRRMLCQCSPRKLWTRRSRARWRRLWSELFPSSSADTRGRARSPARTASLAKNNFNAYLSGSSNRVWALTRRCAWFASTCTAARFGGHSSCWSCTRGRRVHKRRRGSGWCEELREGQPRVGHCTARLSEERVEKEPG